MTPEERAELKRRIDARNNPVTGQPEPREA